MGFLDRLFGTGKNDTPIDSIPENWSLLQSVNDGKPMLIRKNSLPASIVGHKSYGLRCGISFHVKYPDEFGLPQIEKEPELNEMEDDIFDSFEGQLKSIVVMIITTSGFREFVLYTQELKDFEMNLEILKEKYPQYLLTSYSESDPDWSLYKSYSN